MEGQGYHPNGRVTKSLEGYLAIIFEGFDGYLLWMVVYFWRHVAIKHDNLYIIGQPEES